MDDVGMHTGVIPLRHSSLPGQVRLPSRYEFACRDVASLRARRKVSHHAQVIGTSFKERMDDLMQAMLWIKQELILLRQHDILLKRQFFDIQDTIKSLQKPTLPRTAENSEGTDDYPDCSEFPAYEDYLLKSLFVRPSSSFTMLNEDSEEERDIFIDNCYRPRTSSMKTCRDLAALARRRGSKDLV